MDILYYSNYCKHSQKIVQTLVKSKMNEKVSFICIDKRKKNPQDNQTYIELENGAQIVFPPNIHSVPALLLVKENYHVLYGDDILQRYHSDMKNNNSNIVKTNGEPIGYHLNNSIGGTNITSERFTDYSLKPDDLSSKSTSKMRNMYNYVSVNDSNIFIETPEETYKPDKISNDITVDSLQQKRIDEIQKTI